ncbi:unnamed protein product [Peronospora belbahrii]|uniref:Uncharacterized protein n=1 Tax=Peronospora belbahrii TaxID=622444 RepID=A0AAU9L6Z4_9STRA|nr:unnamed protein product [Peronospora belbahrii]
MEATRASIKTAKLTEIVTALTQWKSIGCEERGSSSLRAADKPIKVCETMRTMSSWGKWTWYNLGVCQMLTTLLKEQKAAVSLDDYQRQSVL